MHDLAQRLAAAVDGLAGAPAPVLIGIDGSDAAGKTTLADRLAGVLPEPVLHISAEESLRRAAVRDRALFGSAEEVERRYRARYLPGQALYRREADPAAAADVLIDNDDVSAPRVLRWTRP